MQKVYALYILVASAAADRCGEAACVGNVPQSRSLLQKANEAQLMAVEIDDDDERKRLIPNLDLDVKVMEANVGSMFKTMKAIEDTLGIATNTSGASQDKKEETSSEDTPSEEKTEASLQQTASEPNDDNLKARLSLLERHVADLLSRTMSVEAEVGVAQVSLLGVTSDPLMGMANRAVELHVKVHDLQGRIKKMEHTVIESFQPDATLLKKKVEVLEGKVNVLKSSVQGTATEDNASTSESSEQEPTEEAAAPSLLGVGSSDEGLKSQVSDLETRMENMLSTTARLESEVNGVVSQVTREEVLLQREEVRLVPGATGMTSRVASLHAKEHDLQARVTKLERAVHAGLTPDAALLKKEVGVLEEKVNTLKTRMEGPVPSLLEIGSSEEGLKSQVLDLEMRVSELLSTTASLETELHGLSKKPVSEQLLLQKENTNGNHGLVPRVSVLKEKVSNLKSRVFKLEQHVTGL